MIFFDEIEYAKIPIWENERRIEALTVFRDLYLERVISPPDSYISILPTAGRLRDEGQRTEINQRIGATLVAQGGQALQWPPQLQIPSEEVLHRRNTP
jgi:hypothetical protein